jgi:hypothetical protein
MKMYNLTLESNQLTNISPKNGIRSLSMDEIEEVNGAIGTAAVFGIGIGTIGVVSIASGFSYSNSNGLSFSGDRVASTFTSSFFALSDMFSFAG